jgi:membrane protein DedA with SNARE-associated domain
MRFVPAVDCGYARRRIHRCRPRPAAQGCAAGHGLIRRPAIQRGHPMAIDLAPWIAAYGYPATLAGALFEGETVLVLAGLFAHRGVLDLWWLIALGAIGGATGDTVYFALGRRYGKTLLARFPKYAPASDRVQAMIQSHPELSVFGIRFLYGLRTVGVAVIGNSAVSWPRFLILNALGALVWSACWVGAGYVLGEAAQRLLGRVVHVEREFAIVALAVAVIASIVLRLRRRRIHSPRRPH